MKYSKVGKGKIYLGDTKDIFPKIAEDRFVIITDPPYNIGIKYDNYNDNLPSDKYKSLFSIFHNYRAAIIQYPEETMEFIVPELGIPNKVLTWCYNSNISRQFRLISIYNMIPNLNNSKIPYKNPTDKRIKKLIASGSQGTRCYDWFSDIQLVKNVSKEKIMVEKNSKIVPVHPCQIPIKLIQRLIAICTTKEDIIIDPFMGVGATAIAAESMGREWIGIELSPMYCKLTTERVKEWRTYVDLKFMDTLVF